MADPLTVLPHEDTSVEHGRMTALGARLLDRAITVMNHCTGPHKEEAFADLGAGNLLELGAGGGANLAWLAPGSRLYAVEPNRTMHEALRNRCARSGQEVVVLPVSAENLPLPDGCVDEVICSLVLCTVPAADAAIAEVTRVLRPGGRFRFVEHVAAPTGSLRSRVQQGVRRPWGALCGGCDPHRDTLSRIEAAGFTAVHASRGLLRHSPAWPVNTVAWGTAVR
ncbi:class I SAM-dependent methyltransferase [Brachybacterium sp. YJGR34]|uniref:class I SAM-dependent methyltransferase n=1 Tax=Brachybacterium sp. YJGR34 TaxID=2059911 RepID=UPI000E0B1441|nr:class I SAM-dependent methyltransferase [Brachybacterium sp. YJGR34]